MTIRITLNKRRNSWGEYVIRCFREEQRYKEGDYLTDDWEDAYNTFKYICKMFNAHWKEVDTINLFTGKYTFKSISATYEVKDNDN